MTRPPRVVFVLHEPGYFRLHGSVIAEMAARGWDVQLVFDHPYKRGKTVVMPEASGADVTFAGALPWEPDWRTDIARFLRLGIDYIRYLEPRFRHATYLRRRAEKHLPSALGVLTSVRTIPAWLVTTTVGMVRAIERLIPAHAPVIRFLRDLNPDAIVISPLVIAGESGVRETEVLKSARRLGTPTVVAVASWDHLTSKGLIRLVPDQVLVWNDLQADEVVELHRIRRHRVKVTGAQSLDHWFEVSPRAVEKLRFQLGVPSGRRVLLFVGSSRNMAPAESELRFVRRWISALRASASPQLRDAFVVVRPHPTNTDLWRDTDIPDSAVRVFPRGYSGIPLTRGEIMDFGSTMMLADAVVGVNTTAMIEAAIVGRPVFTVRDQEFGHSQEETLHFAYLEGERGCAITSASLDAHVAQLDATLCDPAAAVRRAREFVRSFVRPYGLAHRATPIVCDAIEALVRARCSTRSTGDSVRGPQVAVAGSSKEPQ